MGEHVRLLKNSFRSYYPCIRFINEMLGGAQLHLSEIKFH